MTDLRQLTSRLQGLLEYLDRPALALVGRETAADLNQRGVDLLERIKAADDRLAIGLVGGTGVGKSTLINALAGKTISRATDLRPTTNRLVLYRHQDNAYSVDPSEIVQAHTVETLERISLADFPDFDSIEPEHQAVLARHFPRLDLLLWVVDPVKYADRAFYTWLNNAPQASVNSLFIFNKVDEFKQRYGARAMEVANEAADDFKSKLVEYAGLSDPQVLALSARDALADGSDSDQPGFTELVEKIASLREKKQRLAIKDLNLSAMTASLVSDLVKAAAPDKARAAGDKLANVLTAGREDIHSISADEAEALGTTLRRPWKETLSAGARDRAPFPLDFLIFIWDRITSPFRSKAAKAETGAWPLPSLAAFSRRLKAFQSESRTVLGDPNSRLARALDQRWQTGTEIDATVRGAIEALEPMARKRADRVRRKHRWIIRHHLLPLLVIAWPFLPLVMAYLAPLIQGQPGGTVADVQIKLGWGDIWPLIQAVAVIYVLEAVFFLYRLDRKSAKALSDIVREFETILVRRADADQLAVLESFLADLADEIKAVEKLGATAAPPPAAQQS
jgi:GTPase SAR1 family protein